MTTNIKTWAERCEDHPAHSGIVSERMIQARMQEEIDELPERRERLLKLNADRAEIAQKSRTDYSDHHGPDWTDRDGEER